MRTCWPESYWFNLKEGGWPSLQFPPTPKLEPVGLKVAGPTLGVWALTPIPAPPQKKSEPIKTRWKVSWNCAVLGLSARLFWVKNSDSSKNLTPKQALCHCLTLKSSSISSSFPAKNVAGSGFFSTDMAHKGLAHQKSIHNRFSTFFLTIHRKSSEIQD